MNRIATAACAAALALGLAGTSGCADLGEPSSDGSVEDSGTQDGGAQDGGGNGNGGAGDPDADSGTGGQGSGTDAEPDLVGKGLAIARERAEKAGYETRAYDSTGRDRTPVIARNWQVCFQEPAEQRNGDPTIRLGVVRTSEDCPEEDGSRNQPELGPDNQLPDFTGANLQVSTEALGASASVDPVDASERDRRVYIPQNWRVCDQSPDPGTTWDGEPVTFQVVKYGEQCP